MDSYVDRESAMTCTALVWSGQLSPEDIVLIDQSLLDWMQGSG